MKFYLKNTTKLGILLFGISTMLLNCNQDINEIQILEQEKSESVGTSISYVSDSEVPDVINSITSFTGKSSIRKSSKNKWIDYKSAYIDINKILKVKDSASITNYSFSITVDDSPINEFYNLIVNEDNTGKVKSPYVIKYVVDDDALDAFLMNDKDFRYFKGRQYIMPFQDFFEGVGVFSKSSSTSDDCIIETGIDNTGNGGNGDFYDIPNDHPLKTDPNAYDYAQYEYGESYKLDLNTYGGTTGSTSYQETVRDEQFPVSVLTSHGYSQYAINVPISSAISPPTGVAVTNYYNSQGNLIMTITTFYGGSGSSTRIKTFFPWVPDEHLDKQSNTSKTQIDCAGIDGEIGVNTIDLGRSVASALGIVPYTDENRWLIGKTVNKASLLELISLTDYIAQNTNSQGVLDPEAKEFGNEIVDSGVANTLVTTFPFVKYPPNSSYATQYPKLTEYLKNQLPTIGNNTFIVNAIKQYTNLTTAQIQEHLKWGEGPTIQIVQLDNYCSSCSSGTYGLFKNTTSDILYIDVDLVNDLEVTSPGSKLADAFSFLVGVTILHEYVHYGDNLDGEDFPGEEGNLFEADAYGQTVGRHNAETILQKIN